MCCFQDALKNCAGSMDPYGDMPLAGGMTASAEIDIMDMDNGVHVSVVKTPPRNGRIRLSDVLESIMGPQMGLECAADQGKRKPEKQGEKPDDSGKMKDDKPDQSEKQGPHPWAGGKSGESTDESGQIYDKDSGRKEFSA